MLDGCFECGSSDDIHHHHVVPRSLGGTKTVPLCCSCHGKVHGEHLLKVSTMTKAALAKKKENGERTGGVLWGYDVTEEGKLIQNQEELALMQRILDLRANGLKLREIALKLNEEGVRLRGKKLYEMKVHRIIKRSN